MDSQPWPERLREALHRQALPPLYIGRLVEELAEHAMDLQQETSMEAQAAFARLGSAEQIAAAAGSEYRRRSFAGRHPWLTFVAGPVVLVPLLLVSLVGGLIAGGWVIATAGEWVLGGDQMAELPLTPAQVRMEWWFLGCFDGYVRFIPFVLAAWLFCRWAHRSRSPRFGLAACFIVALIAGIVVTRSVPSIGEKPGLWIVGFGFQPSVRQLVQVLAPLALGVWLLARPPRWPFATPSPAAGIPAGG